MATHAPPRGGVVRRRALPPVGLFSDAIALNESIAAEVRPRAGPGAGAGDGGRSAGLSPSARGQVRETKDEHTLAVLLNNLASTMEKLRMPREAPAPVEALLLGQALTPLCPPSAQAEAMYERSIELCSEHMEPDDPRVAHIRSKLAKLQQGLFSFPGRRRP